MLEGMEENPKKPTSSRAEVHGGPLHFRRVCNTKPLLDEIRHAPKNIVTMAAADRPTSIFVYCKQVLALL